MVGSNKELARIFRIGMMNPDELAEDEFVQFGYLGISLFRRFENVFFQSNRHQTKSHRRRVVDCEGPAV